MYKVERKIATSGVWEEVMLSPFKTREEVSRYYSKYSVYFSEKNKQFRMTNLETGGKKLLK